MKNQLLGIIVDIILPIVIIIASIIIAIFLYKKMKKKFDKPLDTTIKQNQVPQISLRKSFCTEEEMKFLEALHRSLPSEFISFPHVGVTQLIEPKNNMNDYRTVIDKYVDVCIFLRKEMKPVLVIDLFSQSPVAHQLKKFDDNVSSVLKVAKIPVLHKQVQNSYNLEELLKEVLNKMDASVVTYLKDKITSFIGK
jgi:hypothetical protein